MPARDGVPRGHTAITSFFRKMPCQGPCLLSAPWFIQTESQWLIFVCKDLRSGSSLAQNLPRAFLQLTLAGASPVTFCRGCSVFIVFFSLRNGSSCCFKNDSERAGATVVLSVEGFVSYRVPPGVEAWYLRSDAYLKKHRAGQCSLQGVHNSSVHVCNRCG